MAVSVSNPAGLGAPVGKYSHVSQATGGRLVFVAGQVAVDETGALVGEEDIDLQVRQVYHNVGTALDGAGAGWGDVVKMTTYLTSETYIERFYAVREELFSDFFPSAAYPPNTLLVVSRLVRPEFLVEIEATAVCG
jgi:2-iminobutanoate/2-iminopropanoate deaminase